MSVRLQLDNISNHPRDMTCLRECFHRGGGELSGTGVVLSHRFESHSITKEKVSRAVALISLCFLTVAVTEPAASHSCHDFSAMRAYTLRLWAQINTSFLQVLLSGVLSQQRQRKLEQPAICPRITLEIGEHTAARFSDLGIP